MSKESSELVNGTNPLTAISQIYSNLSVKEQAISGLPLILMLAVFWNLDKFVQEQRLSVAILSGGLVTISWILILAKNLLEVDDDRRKLTNAKNGLLSVFRDRLQQLLTIKRQVEQISNQLDAYEAPELRQSVDSLLNNLNKIIQESQSRVLEITDSSKNVKTDREYAEEAQRLRERMAQEDTYGKR